MLKQALKPSDAWFASNPPIKQEISCCDRWHILHNIVDQFTAIHYNLQPVGIFLPLCYMYLIKFSWHLRHTLTTTQCVKKQFNCQMLKKYWHSYTFPNNLFSPYWYLWPVWCPNSRYWSISLDQYGTNKNLGF